MFPSATGAWLADRSLRRRCGAVAVVVGLVALRAVASDAGAPGQNGRVALLRGDVSVGTAWQLGRPIDLYAMNADGSEARPLVRDAVAGSFSHDGNRLVFLKAADRGGSPGCPGCSPFSGRASVLTVANADGSSPRALTTRGDYLSAHFSPDGRRIAFMRVDGGARALLSYSSPTRAGDRDLRRLRQVRYGLHTIAVDGRGPRRIATIRGGLIAAVASSPDGRRVVVAQAVPGGTSRLLGVAPDGTVTTIGTVRQTVLGLDVSPSGDRLAVALWSRASSGIYVMASSGGSLRRLTGGASMDFAPVWSPDGTAIDFARMTGGRSYADAIYTVPAGGGQSRRLRDFGAVDVLPIAWQPPSRQP